MRKLLRLPAVMEMTGISESSVYRLVREKKFPQPIHVAVPKMTAGVSDDIENWIEEQIEKDRG